jgi:16S rRNA (guanine1207-N2)-methyltransferase
LDVGCGYGPISLSLSRHFDGDILGIDVNPRALELARENKEINEIDNVTFKESYIYEGIDQKYDSIITNPPIRAGKSVVHDICIGGYEYLNNLGEMWVVIQKKQGAPSLIAKMKEVYQKVNVVKKSKGYYIICGIRVDS